MKTLLITFLALLLLFVIPLYAQDWDSSPDNWKNSKDNWENSSSNWKNSPDNWQNSSSRFGNERTVRDNEGNITGYEVPKKDGGSNIYDKDGKRTGYTP